MIRDFAVTVTIANGASLSSLANLGERRLFAIQMPSAWTAGNLTFQATTDGTNYFDLYDEFNTEVTVQASSSRYIILEPARWLGLKQLKVRSGTSGVPVAQGAARTITLILID